VPAVEPITPPQAPLPTISMLSVLPVHKIAEMRVLAKSDAQEDHYALAKMLTAIGIIGDMQTRVVNELCN